MITSRDHYQLHWNAMTATGLTNIGLNHTYGRGFEQFKEDARFSTHGFEPTVNGE
jgi:hypothetical protein